ncbi:hypothetical protein H9P43_002071 [Blastocladiella emersonii ATCC 22665]|nr:hypothetical protein H9P43_002071 [Blastocladiella emersonii ATCC 22665]
MAFSTRLPSNCAPAWVKAVLSGDSLTVKDSVAAKDEKIISLAYLTCPRLSSARKATPDEPLAFEAREVLRRLLVGKEVGLRVEYSNAAGNRDFCSVYVRSPKTSEWVNVGIVALQRGFCKLRDERDANKPNLPAEYPILVEAQRRAQAAQLGLWAKSTPKPVETIHGADDPAAFVKQYKGKTLKAIVEHVRDGGSARMRLLIPDNPAVHYLMWIQVSGIRTPMMNRPDGSVDPIAVEARDYVELRLLHREVELIIEDVAPGANASGAILASVVHPVGNIAVFLVREGLARVHDWTAAVVTGGTTALRTAEAAAKRAGVGMWAGNPEAAAAAAAGGDRPGSTTSANQYNATVIRVVGPDVLLVKHAATGEEIKLWLTSVRPPRRGDGAAAAANPEGWYVVAKEHVRRAAIGRTVSVTVDYEKPANEGYEARTFATVVVKGDNPAAPGINLALDLISQGLVNVQRPRRGEDDNKAANLDDLVIAEAKAMDAKRGMHSGKPAPAVPRLNEVSETVAKAKQFLPFLVRAKRVTGTVDHVVNGSRLRITVPRESAKITLVLAGIRMPRQGEPGSAEALQLTTEVAMQRDVEFEVESVDSTGAFIGSVLVPVDGKARNLATILLENGRAKVHEYSAKASPFATQLFDAERRAKTDRVGLWANYDEEAAAAEAEAALAAQAAAVSLEGESDVKKQLTHVVVSEYLSASHFYLQRMTGDAVQALETMMAKFAAYHASAAATAAGALSGVKPGDLVSAQFTADNAWYRARVRKVAKNAITVFYIDYGNAEVVSMDRIRALPAAFASALPAQAQEARLSYVRTRAADREYGRDAVDRLRDLTEGKKLIANIDRVAGGLVWVSLFDPAVARQDAESPIGLDFASSVTYELVADGLALPEHAIPKPANGGFRANNNGDAPAGPKAPAAFAAALDEAVADARRHHAGMFEYGDVDEESL